MIYVQIPVSDIPSILHYTIYKGIDFLGEGTKIYFLPLISLIFIFFNLILAAFLYKKEKIVSYFFILALPALAASFLLAEINLIIINR